MPAIPNSVSPSMPGPWWTAMVSYVVATCLTAVLLGLLIWWWFFIRTRKAIVEFSISRHADTAQELQELAGWTPPGSSTAGHKEHTETENLGSNGDNGNGEGTSKVEAGSREKAPRFMTLLNKLGSSTAGHKEHTETENLGSNGDNGNGEGTSKVEAGSREEAPRYKGA